MSDSFTPYREWTPDNGDDSEWDADESADADANGDEPLVRCLECRREIYEGAEQCPHCGEYVTLPTSAWPGQPWWWILLGLIGIFGVLFSMLFIF